MKFKTFIVSFFILMVCYNFSYSVNFADIIEGLNETGYTTESGGHVPITIDGNIYNIDWDHAPGSCLEDDADKYLGSDYKLNFTNVIEAYKSRETKMFEDVSDRYTGRGQTFLLKNAEGKEIVILFLRTE